MESVGYAALALFVIGGGIIASIALHEVGHLLPAKRFGVRCSQYMIGFGPTVWSTKRGETEYGVKAVPLGGYVRMLGMFPPKPGRPARADSTGRLGMLVDQAREDAQRDIGPEDSDRLFYQRSVPKRLVIMLGGPVMNLVIAVFLFTILLTTVGQVVTQPVAQTVAECIVPVSTDPDAKPATCTADSRPTPAAAAGVRAGDRIVELAGTPVTDWETLQRLIRANPDRTLPLVVERDGARVPLTVTLAKDARNKLDRFGNPVRDSDGNYVLVPVGFLGVTPTSVRETVPLTAVPGKMADFVGQSVVAIAGVPQKMVGVFKAATGQAKRDPNGPVSIVGVGRMGLEVAATDAALKDKLATWIGLVASLNLALFVFNLVPLLPLDGGHVAGALWEAVRRRANRLLRRPDPGPVDIARLLPLTYVVASVLLVMSVLLMYADIVNPIRITG